MQESIFKNLHKKVELVDQIVVFDFFFSSRRRHTRLQGDWSSDVCSSDLSPTAARSAVSTSCTAASGSPALLSPARTQAAMARFDSSASEPPRRMQALPDFTDRKSVV